MAPFLNKGIGLATVYYGDIDPDFEGGIPLGVRGPYIKTSESERAPDEWGAVAAWAWGLSRAIDYFETDKDVDAKRIAIVGISRLGKTVLWAGAHDTRIAMVIASCSGEGGASLSRRNYGERVRNLNGRFPYWFARNYLKFGDDVDRLQPVGNRTRSRETAQPARRHPEQHPVQHHGTNAEGDAALHLGRHASRREKEAGQPDAARARPRTESDPVGDRCEAGEQDDGQQVSERVVVRPPRQDRDARDHEQAARDEAQPRRTLDVASPERAEIEGSQHRKEASGHADERDGDPAVGRQVGCAVGHASGSLPPTLHMRSCSVGSPRRPDYRALPMPKPIRHNIRP